MICLLCACCIFLQFVPVYAEDAESYPYTGFCGTYQQIFIDGKLLCESGDKLAVAGRYMAKDSDRFLPRNMADGSYAFENRKTANRFAKAEKGRQIPATIYNIYNDTNDNAFKGLNDNTQHWILEYSGEDGVFYLKNLDNKLYLGLSDDEQVISVEEPQKAKITFKAHPEDSPLCLLSKRSEYQQLNDHQRSRLEQIYESVAGDVFDQNGAYPSSFSDPMTPRKKIDSIYAKANNTNLASVLQSYLSTKTGFIASMRYVGYTISDRLPGTAGYTAKLDPPIEDATPNINNFLYTTLTVYEPDGNVDQTIGIMVQNNDIAKKNAEYFAQVIPQIPHSYRKVVRNVNIEKANGDYFNYSTSHTLGIYVPSVYTRDIMMSKVIHELGHGQDVAYGGGGGYWHWTYGGEWSEAAQEDIFTPSQYGHIDGDKWNEDFAEFCHFYFASYTNRDWQRAFEILFPNRSRLFRQMRVDSIDGLSLWEEQLGSTFGLTLDPCGGSVTPTAIQAYHGGVYGGLPIPTRTGYHFDGWYTKDNELITAETEVTETEPQTLYAHWISDLDITGTLEKKDDAFVCHVKITGEVIQGQIIAAAYSGGRLCFTEIRPYTSDTEDFTVDTEFDTLKVMLWSGLEDMKPLTDAVVITK